MLCVFATVSHLAALSNPVLLLFPMGQDISSGGGDSQKGKGSVYEIHKKDKKNPGNILAKAKVSLVKVANQ